VYGSERELKLATKFSDVNIVYKHMMYGSKIILLVTVETKGTAYEKEG
jgi:hypothetical protein